MFKVFKDRCNSGFQMTFENGWTVSVQFGRSNYCANQDYGRAINETGIPYESADAEIAAWDADGIWFVFDDMNNTVNGWVKADEVSNFIAQIAGIDEYKGKIYRS